MNPWQFLIPDNPVALGVLGFLSLLFIAWLLFLFGEWFRLRRNNKELRESERVGVLETALKRQIALQRTKTPVTEIIEKALAEKREESNLYVVLEDFFESAGIKKGSTVRSHIRAIFEAGWNNSQLQIEPLLKNTARRLFSRNGLLRSILSLFIIVGLLGTLFGLAHSLSELLPLMPDGTQLTNTVAAQGLGKLLTRLRGAFAPSIWGVTLTIIGVLLFSFYLKSCQSVIDELEHLTLTVWFPRLCPNPFQQQLITLIETEDLIRKNRAHIQTVADFASHIKEDAEVVGTEMRNARSTIADLNESSSQINKFAVSFAEGVGRLVPFQTELGQLYSKMMQDSKVFQEGVSESLFNTTEVQRQARDTLIQQSDQLMQVIGRLRSYEDAFVDSHQELDKVLKDVMMDARKAYQDIGKRNEEIVGAIDSSLSVPLRGDLTEKLTALNETLKEKLSSLVNSFGTFDTPIKDSAQRFELIVGTIDTRASELMARLQHEYQRQNEANVDQLVRLEIISGQLVSFIETLTKVTFKQETSYTALSTALPGVQEKLITLDDSLRSVIAEGFPSIASNGGAMDTGGLEKQIRENTTRLVAELDKLVRIGDDIRKFQSRNGKREQSQPISPVVVTTESSQPSSEAKTIDEKYVGSPVRRGLRGRLRTVWKKLTRRKE